MIDLEELVKVAAKCEKMGEEITWDDDSAILAGASVLLVAKALIAIAERLAALTEQLDTVPGGMRALILLPNCVQDIATTLGQMSR